MNARSVIKVYWTTDPTYMVYGNFPRKWDPTGKPNISGTPRTIIRKWEKERARAGLNSGVYFIVKILADGKETTFDEIRYEVAVMDDEKKTRRYRK